MTRRLFLGSLAAAFVADPERALWVPGAKTISIPAAPQFQSGCEIERYYRRIYYGAELCRLSSGVRTIRVMHPDGRIEWFPIV
jgi:hypothetical protein